MADLIDRQAAIDAICQDYCGTYNADCKTPFDPSTDDYYHCDGCVDVELIKALPCEDVQPVVRCKDCKYWHDAPAADGFNSCEMDALIRHEGFFCANGEGKDGEQND